LPPGTSETPTRSPSSSLHNRLECTTKANKRYRHLLVRGKTKHQTVVAIGRELLGFIWAIASVVKVTSQQPAAA